MNLRIVYESWYITEINSYVFPHDWLIYPRVQLRKGFWTNLDYFPNVSSMRKHFKQNTPHGSITEIHYSFPSPSVQISTKFSVQVINAEMSVCLGHISVFCVTGGGELHQPCKHEWPCLNKPDTFPHTEIVFPPSFTVYTYHVHVCIMMQATYDTGDHTK